MNDFVLPCINVSLFGNMMQSKQLITWRKQWHWVALTPSGSCFNHSTQEAKVPPRAATIPWGRRPKGSEHHLAVHPENQTQPLQSEMDKAGAGTRGAGEHYHDIKPACLQAIWPSRAAGVSSEGSHHGRLSAAQPPWAGRWRHVSLRACQWHRGWECCHYFEDWR